MCIAAAKVVNRREINYDNAKGIEKTTDELSNQLWCNVGTVQYALKASLFKISIFLL